MRYYKILKNDILFSIGTGPGGTEITEAEYNAILSEIGEKAAMVDKLYSGEITIDDIPAEWQVEIQRRVDERIAAEGEAADAIDPDEAVSAVKILLGMEE